MEIANLLQRRVISVSKWRACAIRLSISLILAGRFSATIRRRSEVAAAAYPVLWSVFISRWMCGSDAVRVGTSDSFNIIYLPKLFSGMRH